MEDFAIGTILAIKGEYADEDTARERVRHFISDWTLTPIGVISEIRVNHWLRKTFAEFIDHVKSPSYIMNEYWHYCDHLCLDDAIIETLRMVQVRENHGREYVNGFKDFSFGELELALCP